MAGTNAQTTLVELVYHATERTGEALNRLERIANLLDGESVPADGPTLDEAPPHPSELSVFGMAKRTVGTLGQIGATLQRVETLLGLDQDQAGPMVEVSPGAMRAMIP